MCGGGCVMTHASFHFERIWNTCFNLAKSHCITFDGSSPTSTKLTLDRVELKRVGKLKNLRCHFVKVHVEQTSAIEFKNFM